METLERLLPAERRARLERMRNQALRREPLCAYAMLRWALRERYGWRTLPEIRTAEGGKPGFADHPEVHFNISHTEGAVLVGLADRPVGADIERLRPVSPRLMSRMAGTTTEQAFFRLWVRREARTKRDGSGIGAMLRREPPMKEGEHYRELVLFPGYLAGSSVCCDEPPAWNIRSVTLDELLAANMA